MIDAIRRYLQATRAAGRGAPSGRIAREEFTPIACPSSPCQPVLKRYMDGEERRQILFLLQSRRFLGRICPVKAKICSFSPTLMHGSGEKMPPGELPELGENRVCLEVSLVTSATSWKRTGQGMGGTRRS